ncbi:MAG TPA: fatty acyl-AMP ligase [Vicinamibacterales bacterium]|jgi:fatty-acyl-CoA synthase|nr:fatty acyl-AMP ligase [Vicinamibacterales bacterium]
MPRLRTLPEALSAASHTDHGFVFLADGGEVRRSFAALRHDALGVAQALIARGLRPGDLVALVIADAEPFLTSLFGASLAGLIPASLYPPATMSDLPRYVEQTAGILRTARACAVVTTAALQPSFEALRADCPDLALVLSREELDAPPVESSARIMLDDLAFVQFTSGSTSAPKGVALTHRSLAANIEAINGPGGLGVRPDDSGFSWLPLYHDMGLVGMTLGALYSGRTTVLMPPHTFVKRPVTWLRAISQYRSTVSFAPNFAYDLCVRRVKARDLDGLDLSCWRIAGCGAEPVHAPTLAAFADKFAPVGFRDTSFLPSYGLAEHVLAATFPPHGRAPRVESIDADDLTDRRLARPTAEGATTPRVTIVSCGMPLPDHQIRIVGEDGQELPERAVGEITLAGPSVMLGYYKEAALTAETLSEGWLRTGDLGYLADGELFVCGRVKDVIIVNGRKYHPQDLEWGVDDVAGVRRGRVVAFGVPQAGGPDRVAVVAEPSGTVGADVLVESIRRRISDLCGLYVDDVVLVPSGAIGRTTSGKVQRAATKARYERGDLAATAP